MKFRKTMLMDATQYRVGGVVPDGVCLGECVGRDAVAHIHTMEGDLTVSDGDWVMTGVQGEHWAIKPDVFAATYEPASRSKEPQEGLDLAPLLERFEGQINEWEMWDRDPSQAFERLAAEFYAETGLMAPGKSVPIEMYSSDYEDRRQQRYTEWGRARVKARHTMLREVLARLRSLSRTTPEGTPDEKDKAS